MCLPCQPEPRRSGERFFHHRSRIDKHLCLAACLRQKPACQRLEPRLDDIVIVRALRIHGDGAAVAPLQNREGIVFVDAIVDAEHDNGAHLRP